MKNDDLRRRLLPPPPLFTIRPPPKPHGSLFDNFQTIEILNGRCIRPSLNILNLSSSSPSILQKHEEQINWLHLFLLILAIISVICCIIIAIFIFICLKKLRKEEKQYNNYVMSDSLSSKNHRHHQQQQHFDTCTRTNEHYKCTSNTVNCCDDYYSHQLIPMNDTSLSSAVPSHQIVNSSEVPQSSSIGKVPDDHDTPQNHQYECIPEYLLTMTRHRHPSHQLYHQTGSTCGAPYATFSRSYLVPRGVATASTSDSSQCTCSAARSVTVSQEESAAPLLVSSIPKESHKIRETSSPKSMMIGWTRRNPSSSTKQKTTEQRHSFLSQLRKSTILQ